MCFEEYKYTYEILKFSRRVSLLIHRIENPFLRLKKNNKNSRNNKNFVLKVRLFLYAIRQKIKKLQIISFVRMRYRKTLY